MNLFKGKIKCLNCGKNYNYKNDNSVAIYICSGYKNYGSKYCQRNIVHEDDLIKLVQLHYQLDTKKYDKNSVLLKEYIQENINKIEVDGDKITIFYKDEISEWDKRNLLI